MIKAETIISELRNRLPLQTGLFNNDDISISTLTRSGTTVTAVTAIDHQLSAGRFVTVKDALSPISVTSITRVLDADQTTSTVTVVTASDHDFTEDFDQTTQITGADQTQYNGTVTIVTVANRRTFTYTISTTPVTPATGTIFVLNNESTGYNGRHQVATIVDSTTFTYEITQTPVSPAQGTPVMRAGLRVSGAVSIERAAEAYTRQKEDALWAFVVLENVVVSKDRNISTDASSTLGAGDAFFQRVVIPFSVYVIAPTKGKDTGGREVRDQMVDVGVALYKSMLGVKLTTVLDNGAQYLATYSSDGFFDFFNAYYVHRFQFETVADISYEDSIGPQFSRAFRDIEIDFFNPNETDGDDVIMQADFSLDDVPL